MKQLKIYKYLNILGVDGAIFYTSLARIFQATGAIITIIFVAKFLTGVEQGFYYTFGSILAIQIFFELGLNGIITQYVAHEVSNLHWETDNKLSGSQIHLSRLSSLLHIGVKWYLILSGFLLIVLSLTGLYFFSKYNKSGDVVMWFMPWIILSISTTIAFLLNPILAFLEGLGKVRQVAQIRLGQQLITTILIWITLLLHAKLFSIGVSSFIGLIVVFLIFIIKYRYLLICIWKDLGTDRVNYRKEIFPFQWKIALSWVSGYFIFQLFNPVLFATEGAIVAGQMGMTLAALNGILSLSFSWMSTKVPLYSGLIAQKKYNELDYIFNRTLRQSVFINILGLGAFILILYWLRYFNISLGQRFLPFMPLVMMMIPVFLNQFINSWATYLRCHKMEPFLIYSIVGGILCSLSTVLLGKYFGAIGVTVGYCIIVSAMFPWGFYIFKTKRSAWHV